MGDTQPPAGPSTQASSQAINPEQLQQLLNELHGLRQQNAELQAQLNIPGNDNQATSTVSQPAAPMPLTQQASRPRMRLPDLPKFDGDRRKYKAWRMQARMKLRVDAEAIGDELAKIGIVFNALEKTALSNMASTIHALEKALDPKVHTLLEHLDKSYRNPHEIQQARQRLATMKQGTRSFVSFVPDFEQCLADADGSEWPEDVKQDRLCEAISPKILEAMVGRTWPKSYDETITLFRKIAEDQYYLSQRNTGTAKNTDRSPVISNIKPEVDVMDWEPTIATKVNAYTPRNGNLDGHPKGPGLPNDYLLRGKRARWVSEEELNRRKADKVCWRCARKGCTSKVCPLAAPVRPKVKASNTAVETPALDVAAIAEDLFDGGNRVEEITEQGNE